MEQEKNTESAQPSGEKAISAPKGAFSPASMRARPPAKAVKKPAPKTKSGSSAAKPGAHHCHAIACERACPPECLMCSAHWRMVSRAKQRAVWASYRPGQCDDKSPSARWLEAAKAAIGEVAQKEGHAEAFEDWIGRQARMVNAISALAEEIRAATRKTEGESQGVESVGPAADLPDQATGKSS